MKNDQATQLIFELSRPGREAVRLPACDVPKRPLAELLPQEAIAASPPPLPEVSEPDLVRHFVNLSTRNMSVDTHFYPLGSCTMKYNPKRNERLGQPAGPGGAASLSAGPDAARNFLRFYTQCRRCWRKSRGWTRSACNRPPGPTAR